MGKSSILDVWQCSLHNHYITVFSPYMRICWTTLRENCLFSELFWSAYSSIRISPYLSVFSPNAGKYVPEQLWIKTLFRQCKLWRRVLTISEKPVRFLGKKYTVKFLGNQRLSLVKGEKVNKKQKKAKSKLHSSCLLIRNGAQSRRSSW